MMKTKKTDPHPKEKNKNPLDLALKYLTHQPRSIHEIRGYLTKKGFDGDIVNHSIEILLEKKYLDDKIFTRSFIENRVNNKPKSKFALSYELNKKGVDPVVIADGIKEYDDHDLALKALEPKIRVWKHLDYEKLKKRTLNFLQYRGFSYDISISLFNRLNQSRET